MSAQALILLLILLIGPATAGDGMAIQTADTKQETSGESGSTKPRSKCHPSYSPCLDANASDYDCAGGAGNGPYYTGRVQVIGPDVFKLDTDGDGWGCELQ